MLSVDPLEISNFSWETDCMGTRLSVYIEKTTSNTAAEVFLEIQKTCNAWEQIFSRFSPVSELSLLNTHKKAQVSDLFFDVFLKADAAYYATNGAFNALCSPFFFGYQNSFALNKWESEQPFSSHWTDICIDASHKTICLPENTFLDFGGIVKGILVQNLSQHYSIIGNGIVVNIGGDVGVCGQDNFSSDISVFHPLSGLSFIVPVSCSVLCTSGTYRRKWKTHHHIIDPFSLASITSDLISATVIHPLRYIAESYATASIIWGIEKSYQFFNTQGIAWYGIGNDGHVYTTRP